LVHRLLYSVKVNFFRKMRAYLILSGMSVGSVLYFNGTLVKRIPGVDIFRSSTQTAYGALVPPINWNQVLMGTSIDSAATQRVGLMLDRIEREKSWGRVGLASQGTYYQELASVSEESISSVSRLIGRTQAQRVGRSGNKAIEQNEDLQSLRTPAAIVAGMTAIYTGRMLRYKVSDDFRLASRSDFSQNQFNGQQLHVITPWVNAMMAYAHIDARSAGNHSQDSLQTSVSKDFNEIGLRARAAYGNTTGATTYGLSKSITEEVTVSYDETTRAASSPANRSVGVGYSHGF